MPCKDCHYYWPLALSNKPQDEIGWCKRYPPSIMDHTAAVQFFADYGFPMPAAFPTVYAENWCGEWKDRGEAYNESVERQLAARP